MTTALPVTIASMASLIVGMSISRFAYTPILPRMLDAGVISHTQGALLASSNLIGYFVGALPAGAPVFRRHAVAVLRASLIMNVATLAAMLVTDTSPSGSSHVSFRAYQVQCPRHFS